MSAPVPVCVYQLHSVCSLQACIHVHVRQKPAGLLISTGQHQMSCKFSRQGVNRGGYCASTTAPAVTAHVRAEWLHAGCRPGGAAAAEVWSH